jgi:hypothetical protein
MRQNASAEANHDARLRAKEEDVLIFMVNDW